MKQSLITPLLILLMAFSALAQTPQPNPIRVYRTGSNVTTATAAGVVIGIYNDTQISVTQQNQYIRLTIYGASEYYTPVMFLNDQGNPWGTTVGSALNTYNASIPLSSGGGGGGVLTTNAGALIEGTLSPDRLPPAAVQTDAPQTLKNKTIVGAVLQSPTGLTKTDVGLSLVPNLDPQKVTSDTMKKYEYTFDGNDFALSGKDIALNKTNIPTKTDLAQAVQSNTRNLKAGTNVSFVTLGDTTTINATGGGGGGSSIVVDAVPTNGSNNAVSSDGAFDAAANVLQQANNATTTAIASTTANQKTKDDAQDQARLLLAQRLTEVERQLATQSTYTAPGLFANAQTTSTVSLSVTLPASATGLTVFGATDNTFATLIGTQTRTSSGIVTFTGLNQNNPYAFRAYASGTGPNSPYSTTVSVTTSATSATPSSITIGQLASFQDILTSSGKDNGPRFYNFQKPLNSTDNAVISNYYLPPGAAGTMSFNVTPVASFSGTANIALDSTTSIYTNGGSYKHTVWLNYNGTFQFNARTRGTYAAGTPPTITAGVNFVGRMRVTGGLPVDSVYYEYSSDGGATWGLRTRVVRYPGTPYNMVPKISAYSTNQGYIDNVVLTGGFVPVTLLQAQTPTPSVGVVTATSFQVSTPAVTGTTSYKFDVADDATFTQNVRYNVSNSASNVLNYSTNITPGKTYFVRVKLFEQGKQDSPFVAVSLTTPAQ